MPFHPAALLSGLAYLALCLLAAGIAAGLPADGSDANHNTARAGREEPRANSDAPRPEGAAREVPACLFGLLSFLCIPAGALPALFPAGWSAAAALLCLAAAFLPGAKTRSGAERRLSAVSGLGVSLAVCAFWARERGMPGDLLSLDAYVSMPLWNLTEGRETAGAALLAAASLLALCGARRESAACAARLARLARELRHFAGAGIWICLFLPAGLARHADLPPACGLALDALYFWIKLLCLDAVLQRAPLPPALAHPFAATGLPLAAGALLLLWK